MQMRMVDEILAPGVENGKETDLSAKMFGIGGNGLEGFSRGAKKNAVNSPFVLQGDIGNLLRHGEDDMEILGVEQFRFAILKPLGAGQRLAFRAVTVRTGVVPNALLSAAITHFDMTAQNGGAARLDGFHHTPLCGRHQGAELFKICVAVTAENIRQFRLSPIHRGGCSDGLGRTEGFGLDRMRQQV